MFWGMVHGLLRCPTGGMFWFCSRLHALPSVRIARWAKQGGESTFRLAWIIESLVMSAILICWEEPVDTTGSTVRPVVSTGRGV